MMYYLYHIPGKKIGVTTDLQERVECQQGYGPSEYDVIMSTTDINLVSKREIELQKSMGYKVDMKQYKDLYKPINKIRINNMRINVTEQTTTFPCPVNKLKGNLMDNIGMSWETDHGNFHIDQDTILWILKNVKTSQFTNERCYIYNKAFNRYYDNHRDGRLDKARQSHDKLGGNLEDPHMIDQYGGKTRSGALSPPPPLCGNPEFSKQTCKHKSYQDCDCGNLNPSHFDLIREWADTRGLYENGDTKTQALKLVEEVGETCRAILKEDYEEITDGIGDCIVVLTNLAELHGVSIEKCIEEAYNEIKNRTGKMENGTYKKD
jgi:NTP pyrophosphatase (non-canonical NTP hydrolase)